MNTTNWKNFFRASAQAPVSVATDIALADLAPIALKPEFLWVEIRFNLPRPDGLSSAEEFPILCDIEDSLVKNLEFALEALEVGRITSQGRRTFYFYSGKSDGLAGAVAEAMALFPHYGYRAGCQSDPEWSNYRVALYPSEEEWELVKNGDVLGVLCKNGDKLKAQRPVRHWVYFESSDDRSQFAVEAKQRGYQVEEEYSTSGNEPYAIQLNRKHSMTPEVIDEAVLELFRLTKLHHGNYDGWETEVVGDEPSDQ